MPPNIQAEGKNHQSQEQEEPEGDCFFHEFIAYFTTGDYFPNQKEHITAIQCRNRQEVHESQDNA